MSSTRDLVIHVRIPEVYAEDLEQLAEECDCSVYDILVSEDFKSEVLIGIVSQEGDLTAHTGMIVGATVVNANSEYGE